MDKIITHTNNFHNLKVLASFVCSSVLLLVSGNFLPYLTINSQDSKEILTTDGMQATSAITKNLTAGTVLAPAYPCGCGDSNDCALQVFNSQAAFQAKFTSDVASIVCPNVVYPDGMDLRAFDLSIFPNASYQFCVNHTAGPITTEIGIVTAAVTPNSCNATLLPRVKELTNTACNASDAVFLGTGSNGENLYSVTPGTTYRYCVTYTWSAVTSCSTPVCGTEPDVEIYSQSSYVYPAAFLVIPIATDDSATTYESVALNIPVTDNDVFGADGPSTTSDITVTSVPANGTAVVNINGTPNDPSDDLIYYSPNGGFTGTDMITYEICDETGDCDQATVTVTVNTAPDADGDMVPDLSDIDDDNDGVLDATESPGCFYTEAEALTIQGITTEIAYPAADDLGMLHDGFTSAVFNFNTITNGIGVGTNIFTLEFPVPVNLGSVNTPNRLSSTTAAAAQLYGSLDGANWTSLSLSNVVIGNSGGDVFPVEQNAGYYTYYKIEGTVAGNTSTSYTQSEITVTIGSDPYSASANPKPTSCSEDNDSDGTPNHLDLDSDNDGIPDLIEAGGVDTNGDGAIDYPTPGDPTTMVDLDGDGLADIYDDTDSAGSTPGWVPGTPIADPDSDGDGIPDTQDLDSDNDGITDLVEADGVDTNGDGLTDTTTDADGDGFADIYDPDDDGTPGIDSGEDAEPLVETDGSGNLLNGETGSTLDTDGDGHPDHKDLDSDNDGIPDLVEAGGIDNNGDGKVEIVTDADGDGLVDVYDPDDDGTPGVEDSTDPLMMTGGTDTDGDGKADDVAITFVDGNGNTSDSDGDGFPDNVDKDSDNDGIVDLVEVGGEDTDGNGEVDASTDDDGDGLADVYDENAADGPAGTGTNGTALVETTVDTNADGKIDGNEAMIAGGGGSLASINQDSLDEVSGVPVLPNHLDIDSDNDGISDNTEAQPTGSYASPTGMDADGDGLDNAYDPDFVSGESIVPVNTDMTDGPDYLDSDSDNDGTNDNIEGHDTDGDGSADATSPAGNGGTSPCNTDADEDGLLDCYDNDITSKDPDNGSLQPTSHPDVVDAGADRDWRQGKCTLCAMVYAIQDGNGVQTTTYKYDSSLGKLESTADTHGTIRTNKYCETGGWRYYYNPAEPTAALFAMQGDASDLDNLDYIELKVGQDPNARDAGINNDSYSRLMNRDWFVKMKAPQVNPINIRFYYPGSDYGTNGYIAANTRADGFSLTDNPTFVWFKISNWDSYEPTLIEASATSIVNAIGFESLSPTADSDLNTGLNQTDGTPGVDIGNGKNYVQFNGLTNFSGGTAGFGAGDSDLPQGLLPVELSRFEGKAHDCDIELSWTVEIEIDFSHYELERSFDGQQFTKISSVEGRGEGTSMSYGFTDKSAGTINYYRLKLVDLDGSTDYSNAIYITALDCGEVTQGMTIYPNPLSSNEEVSVRFHAVEGKTKVMIFSALGTPVKTIEHTTIDGWNSLKIYVGDLPAGLYHIVDTINGGMAVFVVQ